jgi:sugar lactone lactonase YvrE
MVSKCRVIITSKLTIASSLLFVLATVMMSSMVSNADAAPFIGIFFWKVWYCLNFPCFNYPNGIAVDPSGNVFVADTSNYRIEKTSNSGGFILEWGNHFYRAGIKPDEFNSAFGVAVDSSGNVLVTDNGNNRIQEFTNTGKFIRAWGSRGSATGQFVGLAGIAVDSSGNVFVADSGNGRIQKFQLATPCPKGVTEITSGVCFIKEWGSYGRANGQFDLPRGIAVDSSGNVFVTDSRNNRIQKFNNDGTFIKTWGTFGTKEGQFDFPRSLALDSSGNVFVNDGGNSRIQKFDKDSKFVLAWGKEGSGIKEFYAPTGVAVDSSGVVYVVDQYNNRIQKFKNDGGYIRTWGLKGPWD